MDLESLTNLRDKQRNRFQVNRVDSVTTGHHSPGTPPSAVVGDRDSCGGTVNSAATLISYKEYVNGNGNGPISSSPNGNGSAMNGNGVGGGPRGGVDGNLQMINNLRQSCHSSSGGESQSQSQTLFINPLAQLSFNDIESCENCQFGHDLDPDEETGLVGHGHSHSHDDDDESLTCDDDETGAYNGQFLPPPAQYK